MANTAGSADLSLIPTPNLISGVLVFLLLLTLVLGAGAARRYSLRLACSPCATAPLSTQCDKRASFVWYSYHSPIVVDLAVTALIYLPIVVAFTLSHEYSTLATVDRFAYIALPHFLMTTLLGIHFSPFATLLPRLRLILLHKWCARFGTLLALAHVATHFAFWIQDGTVAEQLQRGSMRNGLVAFSSLMLLSVTSFRPVRRAVYGLFSAAHHVFFLLFALFVVLHTKYSLFAVAPMVVAFLANKAAIALQVQRNQTSFTVARGLSDGLVKVDMNLSIASPSAPLPTPDHVVYVAARPWSTFHPFSPRVSQVGAKSIGLTINVRQHSHGFTETKLTPRHIRRLVAFIPPAPHLPLTKFKQVIFVAGGIGITPVLAWLNHIALLQSSRPDKIHLESIHIIWIVRTESVTAQIAPRLATHFETELGVKVPFVECVNVVVTGRDGRPDLDKLSQHCWICRHLDLSLVPNQWLTESRPSEGIGGCTRKHLVGELCE
ncbi:hypothetical protein BCR44DRAFT_1266652 [Catenaria anguillulae PL171]|uniref:FAD-binding FR-type domain-containing protein n=1 Tax=Catenaria anguillulae PL171 TaxID=765915 RepID=A0A1Y2HWN3_9FUNG|nr:hypothetical protein BCR44DRAFT_1266652 [Catenaria anguillulae PL171]